MRLELLGQLMVTTEGDTFLPPTAPLEKAHDEFLSFFSSDSGDVVLPPLVRLEPSDLPSDPNSAIPHLVRRLSIVGWEEIWLFGGYALRAKHDRRSMLEPLTEKETMLEIACAILERQQHFKSLMSVLRGQLSSDQDGRVPIPRDVRLFVWQRDQGRCVQCGTSEALEFDHVIPIAKGGSSTERNLQLLCEPCNRKKGSEL